jgi:hypothetical protein
MSAFVPNCVIRTTRERVSWSSGPTYTEYYEWCHVPGDCKEIETNTYLEQMKQRALKDGVELNESVRIYGLPKTPKK